MTDTPWYETRKKFRRDERLLNAAKRIDASLRKEIGFRDIDVDEYLAPEDVAYFPHLEPGKVSWSTGSKISLAETYLLPNEERESPPQSHGRLMVASTIKSANQNYKSLFPNYLLMMTLSHIVDNDQGFEGLYAGPEESWLYFMEGAFSGLIKIGVTVDPYQRLASIRNAASEPIQMLLYCQANTIFEGFLHGLFEPVRHHGEWFYPHWSIHQLISGMKL